MLNSTANDAQTQAAYRHCSGIVRASHSSFAAAFWMLSRPQRRAMHAIYAFCRLADDIADDPTIRGDRQPLLRRWRGVLDEIYSGEATHPVGIAMADTVARYDLPKSWFEDLLEGIEMDLSVLPGVPGAVTATYGEDAVRRQTRENSRDDSECGSGRVVLRDPTHRRKRGHSQ